MYSLVKMPGDATSHTIGRAIKELSHEDMEYKSSSGNVFRFNTNPRLNDLLMKLNMKMGLLKSGQTVKGFFFWIDSFFFEAYHLFYFLKPLNQPRNNSSRTLPLRVT